MLRTIKSVLAVVLLPSILCACGPIYRPFNGSVGYSESPVRPDQYEVSFIGDSRTSPTQARYLATVRAAEIALERNKPAFDVLVARENAAVGTMAVPENTTITTTRGPGRSGGRTAITSINRSGGYIEQYTIPIATIEVRLLDRPTPTSLNALDLLRQAKAQGIKLSITTQTRLGE